MPIHSFPACSQQMCSSSSAGAAWPVCSAHGGNAVPCLGASQGIEYGKGSWGKVRNGNGCYVKNSVV